MLLAFRTKCRLKGCDPAAFPEDLGGWLLDQVRVGPAVRAVVQSKHIVFSL